MLSRAELAKHVDHTLLKPEAPAEFRGEFKEISTNVAGTRIGELLPRTVRRR